MASRSLRYHVSRCVSGTMVVNTCDHSFSNLTHCSCSFLLLLCGVLHPNQMSLLNFRLFRDGFQRLARGPERPRSVSRRLARGPHSADRQIQTSRDQAVNTRYTTLAGEKATAELITLTDWSTYHLKRSRRGVRRLHFIKIRHCNSVSISNVLPLLHYHVTLNSNSLIVTAIVVIRFKFNFFIFF